MSYWSDAAGVPNERSGRARTQNLRCRRCDGPAIQDGLCEVDWLLLMDDVADAREAVPVSEETP